MNSNIARKHHYVPRFILRPWTVCGQLRGYYWNEFIQDVATKILGVSAFCHELDLLSIQTSRIDADALETVFFSQIDNLGAKAARILTDNGSDGLSAEERSDFVRLLLSLDARRPANVARLKDRGANYLKNELDYDREILEALDREGIAKRPSEYLADEVGTLLTDRALLVIQRIVNNQRVGGVLINALWRVYHLGDEDGSFVLSDRPLIRLGGYSHPNAIWALPLTPKTLFVAANSRNVIQNFDRQTPIRLRKNTNTLSVGQFDRYVFMIDEFNLPLVKKHIEKSGV